jgi:hypothetical protein
VADLCQRGHSGSLPADLWCPQRWRVARRRPGSPCLTFGGSVPLAQRRYSLRDAVCPALKTVGGDEADA